jgi:hypothetical protein
MAVPYGGNQGVSLPGGSVTRLTASITQYTVHLLLDICHPQILLREELKWMNPCHIG